MNIIYEKTTGVRYHYEVHVYIQAGYYINGAFLKFPKKKFVNIASKEEKDKFRKRLKK